MLGRAAYLCLFPAVLIACGSGEPHNAQVSSVAHRYVAAIASDDGSQICSLLTSDARHQLIYDGGVLAAASHSHSHSCAEAAKLTQSLYPLDGYQRYEIRHAKIAIASLGGGHAIVRATQPRRPPFTITLSNTPAGWLVSTPTVRPGSEGVAGLGE